MKLDKRKKCFYCGREAYCYHHINYSKKNETFVPICRLCHYSIHQKDIEKKEAREYQLLARIIK